MTCRVCANPTCVDDCQHYPPPALMVGSAEQKLQELLKIADELSAKFENDRKVCIYCDADFSTNPYYAQKITHHDYCPILKLEQFKQALK